METQLTDLHNSILSAWPDDADQTLQWLTTAGTSFALISAAEIGDKSQLVCMTLATKHRAFPVFLGALAAFIILNTLAVGFGAAIAGWVPHYIVVSIVTLLFAGFGLHALFSSSEAEDAEPIKKSGHGIFLTTLLLIIFAEFGDKTQLAVVALSSTTLLTPVWLGATLALAGTSALGILAGRTVLQRIPVIWINRFSGAIFLLLAGLSGYEAWNTLTDHWNTLTDHWNNS